MTEEPNLTEEPDLTEKYAFDLEAFARDGTDEFTKTLGEILCKASHLYDMAQTVRLDYRRLRGVHEKPDTRQIISESYYLHHTFNAMNAIIAELPEDMKTLRDKLEACEYSSPEVREAVIKELYVPEQAE